MQLNETGYVFEWDTFQAYWNNYYFGKVTRNRDEMSLVTDKLPHKIIKTK